MKKFQTIAFMLSLITTYVLLFHTCTQSDYTDYKPINDSTLIKANISNAKLSNDITKLTKQTDSLKSIKQGLKIVYKENVKRVYLIGPDTCKTYFDTIIKMHDKIDLVNDSTIFIQDSIIKNYSRMIINYKDIIMIKDIQHYNDSLALRKQKRNKIKVGVGAFLGGLLIGIIK